MLKGLWKERWRDAKDPLRSALGDLEREVMEVVGEQGGTTVRRVQEALPRRVAYTTSLPQNCRSRSPMRSLIAMCSKPRPVGIRVCARSAERIDAGARTRAGVACGLRGAGGCQSGFRQWDARLPSGICEVRLLP